LIRCLPNRSDSPRLFGLCCCYWWLPMSAKLASWTAVIQQKTDFSVDQRPHSHRTFSTAHVFAKSQHATGKPHRTNLTSRCSSWYLTSLSTMKQAASVCIKFYDMVYSMSSLSGCVEVVAKLASIKLNKIKLGCFDLVDNLVMNKSFLVTRLNSFYHFFISRIKDDSKTTRWKGRKLFYLLWECNFKMSGLFI